MCHAARLTARRRPNTAAVEPLEARQLMAAGPEFQVAPRVIPLDADASATGRTVAILQGGVSQDHNLPGWGEVTFHTSEVFARVYDASGAAAGPVFRVSDQQWRVDETLGVPRPFYNLDDADVAMQDNGDFTVTWTKSMDPFDTGNAGAASTGLLVRRYTAAGVPKGPAVELPGGYSGDVAMAADGSFVVAQPMYGFSRYDAAGRLLSVRELNDGNLFYPSVAMAPDGRFVMAWSEFPEAGGPVIRAQRFDAAGRPVGASFIAGDHPELMDHQPRVAMNRSGEFAVSWAAMWDPGDGVVKPGEGAYVRRFDAAGNPKGGAFHLARPRDEDDILGGTRTGAARVVLDDAGNLTAAWNQGSGFLAEFGEGDSDVYARRFGPSGQPLGEAFRVNASTAGAHARPDLAVDGAGRVTIFWDAYARSPSDLGATLGRRFTFGGGTPPPPPAATGTASGIVFNDLDADGTRDAGEAGSAGRRVFIDADRDGVFDSGERSALTDASGNYAFANLAPGTYRVRQVLPSGWRRTRPSSGYHDVAVPAAGGTFAGRNFANTQKVLISGTVFNDADRDGRRDAGESSLAGWRVFIDADNDGRFDSGEKSALTDSAGNYRFATLSAGTYRVRVVQQAGWARTTPSAGSYSITLSSGQSATGRLFGQRRLS